MYTSNIYICNHNFGGNIFGVEDHFQVLKVSEWTCTFRGWGTTSRSFRCVKIHVRYYVRTYPMHVGSLKEGTTRTTN